MKRITMTLILLLGIFIITLTGCENSTNNKNSVKEQSPIINQVSIPILNFRTLNPIVSRDESAFHLSQLIYESLVELNDSFEATPLLAENWEYQDGGTSLIFNLRHDVKWHNDVKFTSDDVIFTINTLLNNNRNTPSQYKIFVQNIKRVDKIDDYTLKIVFQNAYDNSIENFIFPIICQTQMTSSNNVYKSINNFYPIGTGPYKVDAIEELKHIKLKKNSTHWKEEKPVSDLIFKIVPSPEESIGLLEINDIDLAVSQSYDWEKYLEDKSLSIYDFTSNEVEVLGFNFNKSWAMDRRIRQAIAYVIDQDEIINNVYLGTGVKSDNVYAPNYLGNNTPLNTYAINLEKSKALLSEAGFENRDNDIYLEDSRGKELELKLLVNSENKNRIATAKIIKKSLDKIGISTNIIYIGYDKYIQYIGQGKYDMYLGGWSVSPLMDFRFALHSKYYNSIHYSNEYLDYLLVELQRHLPREDKQKIFKEIKDILIQDLPYYTLLYKEYAIIAKDDLKGTVKPNIMNIYNRSENWYIQKSK